MHARYDGRLLVRVERELERAVRLLSEQGDAEPVLVALAAIDRMLIDDDDERRAFDGTGSAAGTSP